jgi:rubrerythrin
MSPRIPRIDVEGSTRASFLGRAALAAASAWGVGAVAPFVSRALAKSPEGDLEALSFALMLEHLQSDFYSHALALPLSAEVLPLVQELREQEAQHVEALQAAVRRLGAALPRKPRFTFPSHDEKSFLRLAQALEDVGVSAYNGAVAALDSREIVAAAATIVQVEARHAAAIRLARGQRPAPDAFDAALDRSQAVVTLRPLVERG